MAKEKKTKFNYLVGTMIEIPRAALVADEIAKDAQFFSFGTNDLTQTTLGMSRDDSGSFLPKYQELEIVKKNPFASIDQTGVGKLMEMAVELGRKTRPDIKLGICGEHGGDPDSVKFCHRIGLDLRELLAVPRAGGAAGGGPGRARRREKQAGEEKVNRLATRFRHARQTALRSVENRVQAGSAGTVSGMRSMLK